jgi:tRNA-specific 2-thiouridylase
MSDLSLGFETKPENTRIVVAMSGGVDSCVTAALLVEGGYEVVGMTMQLYDQGQTAGRKGACCAGQDIYDARQVADRLNIPHYVLDYESRFRSAVIDDFVDSYANGFTPIPCIRCNQSVKFRDLLTAAKDLNAQALATGHYVRRIEGLDGPELHRAEDTGKDQSFFLFATTKEQLDFVRFPLGDIPKSQTRAHAIRLGLKVADKPDSQDICFVPDGNYARIVEKLRPGTIEAGKIIHVDGRVLGTHQGTINYTVGQRRGLGVSHEEPLYVVRIDAKAHCVIVGPRENLACLTVYLSDVNWIGGEVALHTPLSILTKIRSTQMPMPATLILKDGLKAEVRLEEPEYGVAPGQACVFYQGTRTLGGGWIASTDIHG